MEHFRTFIIHFIQYVRFRSVAQSVDIIFVYFQRFVALLDSIAGIVKLKIETTKK